MIVRASNCTKHCIAGISHQKLVIETLTDGILIIQLNHSNPHNPFNKQLESDLKEALRNGESDDRIRAIVVTGGQSDRSFSAGGDFNEVKMLKGGPEVDAWIDRVIDLYITALLVTKPTVAAVNNHAIGIGFQLALMFDWRVGSHHSMFAMNELKNGISCTLGACILERVLGRNVMTELIIGCERVSAEEAKGLKILNEIVQQEHLLTAAISAATKLSAYPDTSYRNTKKSANSNFVQDLKNVAEASKQAHRVAFASGANLQHFKSILGKNF